MYNYYLVHFEFIDYRLISIRDIFKRFAPCDKVIQRTNKDSSKVYLSKN